MKREVCVKLVGEDRDRKHRSPHLDRGLASVHASASYDFIVGLRALYNPDIYERARQWTSTACNALESGVYSEGRLFFDGGETALGYGLLRLIPTLGAESAPAEFIESLRAMSAAQCALLMLDTGETSQEALDFYRFVLDHPNGHPPELEAKVCEFAGDSADRSLEVLRDPTGAKDRLVGFLEHYSATVFASHIDTIGDVVERAAASARDFLVMQPALSSIEALTGGYTLSEALRMNEIILAPSVFIYPFMASRVDERTGQAFIVFGVRNDDVLGYSETAAEDMLDSIKVLANPHRLQILVLLRKGPVLGSEFVNLLDLSQPTVHHHLAQLRSSGYIRQERTQDGMRYSFRPDSAESIVNRLAQFFGVG